MHYTQLRAFHAVAEAGGFSAAARVLGVGQPTVTTQVKALESAYGTELFHRRGRRVVLTELGEGLYRITQRLFSAEADARDYLDASRQLRSGHLKVGADGPHHVTDMLAAFNERHPQIRVTVSVGNSGTIMRAIRDFEVDVAVLARMEDDGRYFMLPYGRHPVVLMVNRRHRWARRRTIRIEELEDEPMVLREQGSATRKAFETVLGRVGVSPRVIMEIGSREAVWGAVIRGIGVGIVSEAEFVPHPELRVVGIGDADIHTEESVLCLAERRESPLVAAFFEVVETLLAARRQGVILTGEPAMAGGVEP